MGLGKFGLFRPERKTLPATAPNDRIYAIGDVHGRYDLLRQLLHGIEDHAQQLHPGKTSYVILLGDLIDRGPQSADVLRLIRTSQSHTDRLTVLAGNHEDLMLRALDNEPGSMRAWIRAGGDATLRSFGIEPPARGADHGDLHARVVAAVPREWVSWLRRLPLTARSGDYLFCHAGIRPTNPIKRQTRADLLWIRDEFLYDESDFGAVIVHGHSISGEVEVRTNRIGIDTGAYRTGALTALYLEDRQRETISTTADGGVSVRALDQDGAFALRSGNA